MLRSKNAQTKTEKEHAIQAQINEEGSSLCVHTYCVRGALKHKIYGSVYIFIAVMEGNHALVLSLPSYLNQLSIQNIMKRYIKLQQVTL